MGGVLSSHFGEPTAPCGSYPSWPAGYRPETTTTCQDRDPLLAPAAMVHRARLSTANPQLSGQSMNHQGIGLPAYFCKHPSERIACERTHKRDSAPMEEEATMDSEEVTIGNKAWMLLWAGVSVFAVLCVYAAVWN
jgi:hypothetical protein